MMDLSTRVIIITEFQNLVGPQARGRRLQTIGSDGYLLSKQDPLKLLSFACSNRVTCPPAWWYIVLMSVPK